MIFSSIFKKSRHIVASSLITSLLLTGASLASDNDDEEEIGKTLLLFMVVSPQEVEAMKVSLENSEIASKEEKAESVTVTPSEVKATSSSVSAPGPSEKIEKKGLDLSGVLFADEIYERLIQYTIGQDEAMKSLATYIHQHLINVKLREAALKEPENPLFKGLKLEKPNILMMGPTGCGKTSSLEVISELLNVPFAIGNATEWTTQGYIGGKWQDMFEKLVSNAQGQLRKEKKSTRDGAILKTAGHGIVFIDEIDKICNRTAGELEVIERVQQELLPVIQGAEVKLSSGDMLDTSNILFIAGGAFPGLVPNNDDVSKNDKGNSKVKKQPDVITPRMLEDYGMLRELAGRLCNIVQFSPLSRDDLKRIVLTSKTSALKEHVQIYKAAYDIDLTFPEDTIDYIVDAATRQKTGARGINPMLFELMKEKTFKIRDYIGKPLDITVDMAKKALQHYVVEPPKEQPRHMSMYS